jgi:hydroxyacylglutathione hydrolase
VKLKTYPSIPVIGGTDCDAVTEKLKDGDEFTIGEIRVKALATPCHTQDSICYHASSAGNDVVFTGDTLFIGGCGRFFEGTAEQMDKALNKTLGSLPSETKVYVSILQREQSQRLIGQQPGHEYTVANMKFGVSVVDSPAVQRITKLAQEKKETYGLSTIAQEKVSRALLIMNIFLTDFRNTTSS